jgi:hypothetical protein
MPKGKNYIFLSRYAAPYLQLQFNQLSKNDTNANIHNWLRIGNRVDIPTVGFRADLNIGYYIRPLAQQANVLTAKIALQQRLAPHWSVAAQWEQQPYLFTLRSLDTAVSESRYAFAVVLDNPNSWNGKASIEIAQYGDANTLPTVYGWAFAPPLRVSKLALRVGYAYSNSRANRDQYTSKRSLSNIIANYATNTNLDGIYQPYFTPNDQQIHAALVSATYQPNDKWTLYASANYGFANRNEPYFALGKDAATGATILNKNFTNTNFKATEWVFSASWQLSRQSLLALQYAYQDNGFYKRQSATLGLKMYFQHEK